MCVHVDFLGVCVSFFREDPLAVKAEEGWAVPDLRCHPSELGLTLEDGCGPMEHTLTQDRSKALLLSSGSQKSYRTLG